MNMIERVARAICVDGGFNPDEQMPNNGPRWRYYEPAARSAIQAMREPTEEMLDASWLLTGESEEMRSRTHNRYTRHYSAMIDEALKHD